VRNPGAGAARRTPDFPRRFLTTTDTTCQGRTLMKASIATRRGLTRFGQIGAAVVGTAALLLATQSTGASAQGDNGVAQRLAKLEYAQTIDQAKLEITEQQSLYGLLFNGDGPNGPDRQKWGDQIFTGDEPFLAYDANNNLIASQSFQHMSDEIAGAVAGQPKIWPNTASANGSMHYMFAPVFDKITPTEAITRTPSVSISGEKGTAKVNTATIRVYWDHWIKTDAGWRKTTSTWYRLD
jgi:hypothetical protein